MENMKTNETKLTKKDINSLRQRWIMGSQVTWNYERQMGVGYLWAMIPIIRKLYKDPKDQKEMLKTHVQFFNTTPHMGGFILGIDAATEEHEGMKAKEAVKGLKTGLMGPFAGVGDDSVWCIIPDNFWIHCSIYGTGRKYGRSSYLAACKYCNSYFPYIFSRHWISGRF